jgi:hypothetical protein
MNSTREKIVDTLSEKYCKFLFNLPYDDHVYMKGIHEGKGKFLANLHIYLTTIDMPKRFNDKRFSTDFVTRSAQEVLNTNAITGLEYEHLIPKKKYIQDVCEQKAKEGILTVDFVQDLLSRYLWIATVTNEEHKLLSRRLMPFNWDGLDIRARYELVGIDLLEHDKNRYLRV